MESDRDVSSAYAQDAISSFSRGVDDGCWLGTMPHLLF
jgi:hypothetical protein